MSLSIYPVDFVSINAEQPLQEWTFESIVGQKGTDEEKNCDELFLLLHRIKNPDFVSHEDPHEQIRVAWCLLQLLEVLPFTSFGWKDEDFVENVLEQAVTTLGLIYRRITGGEYPSLMKEAEWLANTLLHLYVAPYDVNINIPHIEKMIVRCLVPLELPPDQRMKKLLQLWCLFDDESRSNFHHLQELKKRSYETVLQLLSLFQEPSADKLSSDQLVWMRAMLAGKITVTMGCQKDVHQRLLLLTEELVENRNLLNFLQEYVTEDNSIEDRNSLWECMKQLDTASEHYLTRAVAVGQFATHLPKYTDTTCMLYISNLCCQLVGRFVLEDLEDERDDVAEWHEKDCLPYKTKCRVMALKALTRLTIRLCNPEVTEKTLTVLSKIIANGGAFRNTNDLR